jgi:hypothetical protein
MGYSSRNVVTTDTQAEVYVALKDDSAAETLYHTIRLQCQAGMAWSTRICEFQEIQKGSARAATKTVYHTRCLEHSLRFGRRQAASRSALQ